MIEDTMAHSSNDDRNAFDEALESFLSRDQASNLPDLLFAAAKRVRDSRDALPGWIMGEIESIVSAGKRLPNTYGAAAKVLIAHLRANNLIAQTHMGPGEIKAARQSLGLTQSEMASMLDIDQQSMARMELSEEASTFRKPAPRTVRLIRAYVDGYRPADWPM